MKFVKQYPNLVSASRRLSSKHLEEMSRSGINRQAASDQGFRTSKSGDSYLMPVFDARGYHVGDSVRIDDRAIKSGSYLDRKRKPRRFYTTATDGNSTPSVHFPKMRNLDWGKIKGQPYQEIYITEGQKKALKMCLEGFPCIALLSPHGGLNKDDLTPALKEISWKDRHVYLVFDNDKYKNPNILDAESRLANKLRKFGAKVHIVDLPQSDVAKGVDDFLSGSKYYRDLFDCSLALAN